MSSLWTNIFSPFPCSSDEFIFFPVFLKQFFTIFYYTNFYVFLFSPCYAEQFCGEWDWEVSSLGINIIFSPFSYLSDAQAEFLFSYFFMFCFNFLDFFFFYKLLVFSPFVDAKDFLVVSVVRNNLPRNKYILSFFISFWCPGWIIMFPVFFSNSFFIQISIFSCFLLVCTAFFYGESDWEMSSLRTNTSSPFPSLSDELHRLSTILIFTSFFLIFCSNLFNSYFCVHIFIFFIFFYLCVNNSSYFFYFFSWFFLPLPFTPFFIQISIFLLMQTCQPFRFRRICYALPAHNTPLRRCCK